MKESKSKSKSKTKKPKKKPKLDFAQQSLANVEKIIGGKLADGMKLAKRK